MNPVETYGQYVIVEEGPPSGHPDFGLRYRLYAIGEESQKIILTLLVKATVEAALSNRWIQDSGGGISSEYIKAKGIACFHGLLDFRLFEKSNEYSWTLRSDGQVFEPLLCLDTPNLEKDPCLETSYHILKALHRTRQDLSREYITKRLDPGGVCLVLRINRSRFEYIVGLLEEDKQIFPFGNAYDGEFYITQLGIQALQAMERPRKSPKWQTKRAPQEVQDKVPAIIRIIEQWIPKQRYASEEAYEAALAEYLVGRGIDAPEQQGGSLTDVLAAYSIGIEVKLTPGRSEYDRLVGQVTRQLEEYGIVIVLILRPDKRDSLEEYKSRFDERVVFVTKG